MIGAIALDRAMTLILNLLWLICGGLVAGIVWILVGVLCTISIIGLPWARAAMTIGRFTLWPFGQTVVSRQELTGREDLGTGALGTLGNLVWLVMAACRTVPVACAVMVTCRLWPATAKVRVSTDPRHVALRRTGRPVAVESDGASITPDAAILPSEPVEPAFGAVQVKPPMVSAAAGAARISPSSTRIRHSIMRVPGQAAAGNHRPDRLAKSGGAIPAAEAAGLIADVVRHDLHADRP